MQRTPECRVCPRVYNYNSTRIGNSRFESQRNYEEHWGPRRSVGSLLSREGMVEVIAHIR